ncbi:MAG: hypothetical protein IKL84_01525 [Clostridia bacterium]|nr:hypothetical protein [Clostridia bacterium]
MKRNYLGAPSPVRSTLQRMAMLWPLGKNPQKEADLRAIPTVTLTNAEQALLPAYIAPADVTCAARDDKKLWIGTNEGLWLLDPENAEPLDRIQCFRATAYVCDNAIKAITPDGDNGVWVLSETGLSHIIMRIMSVRKKAELMSEINAKYMSRRGMLSGGIYDAAKKTFVGECSDNDGLWTALFAMGDLARYAVLRDEGKASAEEIRRAKELATLWTEACLLLACIPGWKGTVPALIRYNEPASNKSHNTYLKRGGNPNFNLPSNGPLGLVEYTPSPAVPEDWAETNAMHEIIFKNVEGYIARSYHVDRSDDEPDYADGVFLKKLRTPEGKLISVRIPSNTWKGDDIPPMHAIDSSMEIPPRLAHLYTDCGCTDTDIIYKCDTSNDELTGHYALWYLAYDILGPEDPELAELIRVIAARHARHLADNDFCLTDCGGQPTSWARMNRSYYMNRGSLGPNDAPLGLAILLQCFKVTAYVTGGNHWEQIYRMLALEEPYRYADLLGEYYERCVHALIGDQAANMTEEEIFRIIVDDANYSDIRMAAIAYYTLCQLETDPLLLKKYSVGAAGWWKFLKYSRDVEWMLVWQLMHPEKEQRDAFGRTCGEMLAWQLTHFPATPRWHRIDNRTRPGTVCRKHTLWYDANTPCALSLDERGAGDSNVYAPDGGRNCQPYWKDTRVHLERTYNLNLSYWLGRYHGILTDIGEDGNVTLDDLEEIIFHGLDRA